MIKKLTQALLALALVGGMTACDKSMKGVDEGTTSATGDTYISVAFSTANPNSTRAEDANFNSIGEYIGRDKVEDVNIYMINPIDESIEVKKFVNNNNTTNPNIVANADNNANTNDFRTEAWKTTPGKKIVYVYVNIAGTAIETALDGAHDKASFEAANKAAYALVENGAVKEDFAKYDGTKKEDVIAMNTVAPETLEVKAGVKKAEAEAATGAKNRVSVKVRRLVAQAAVTSTKDTYEIKETFKGAETILASLGDFKWDVMQYEQKTYLMPQPIDPAANPAQNALSVEFCKSPNFAFIPADATPNLYSEAKDKYAYRAFTGKEVKIFTRAHVNETDVAAIVATPMKFITETTHQLGGKLKTDDPTNTGKETGYRKGNTTYVIVSAKITPKNWGENQESKAGEDLYFGVKDHKFYKELEAAKTANKVDAVRESDQLNAPDNVIKYAGGRCYYVAWLNPNNQGETESKEPIVSPILRNNIYHVNISAIKKLGYSGNPFNPNGDDPKDPDDKTPDPKETLYPVDTYMAVEISVVNWGVHSYDQEF